MITKSIHETEVGKRLVASGISFFKPLDEVIFSILIHLHFFPAAGKRKKNPLVSVQDIGWTG